jgi:hypothetical protein
MQKSSIVDILGCRHSATSATFEEIRRRFKGDVFKLPEVVVLAVMFACFNRLRTQKAESARRSPAARAQLPAAIRAHQLPTDFSDVAKFSTGVHK